MNKKRRVAIVGAGPAGLMVFQKLISTQIKKLHIEIFESSESLGKGMPYSASGARHEHITNVSADELPDLVKSLDEWVLNLPEATLQEFNIIREKFHEKRVVPRLLFGRYLSSQFETLIEKARLAGIEIIVNLNTRIVDVQYLETEQLVQIHLEKSETREFEDVILCTGHQWKKDYELSVPGYYDSPYPPDKLAKNFDHTVIVQGSSLTAIDAVKTIAGANGKFSWEGERYTYRLADTRSKLQLQLHSKNGLLPSVRVHMAEPHVDDDCLIADELIEENKRASGGFLELDFLFEQGFKRPLADTDPAFFEQIKDLSLEAFVDKMMSYRDALPPFELLRREYRESLQSIERERAVPWKEMLASLSFAMNYPAKYLSAEDMLRLRKTLMPLISVVIAFIPQSSCETLLALHDAGILELISDGEGGKVTVTEDRNIIYSYTAADEHNIEQKCQTFVDCIGQRPLNIDDFPFRTLVDDGTICGAKLKFKDINQARLLSGNGDEDVIQDVDEKTFYLRVPGVAINDNFQVVNHAGGANTQLYIMAVPHIGGFNPDYSGLDFCEQASKRVVEAISSSSIA